MTVIYKKGVVAFFTTILPFHVCKLWPDLLSKGKLWLYLWAGANCYQIFEQGQTDKILDQGQTVTRSFDQGCKDGCAWEWWHACRECRAIVDQKSLSDPSGVSGKLVMSLHDERIALTWITISDQNRYMPSILASWFSLSPHDPRYTHHHPDCLICAWDIKNTPINNQQLT